jgi:hypothetical protein
LSLPLTTLVPLSPTRQYLLAMLEGEIQAIDAASGEQLGTLEKAELEDGHVLRAYEFRPDGKVLAAILVGNLRRKLVLWDLETGKIASQFEIAAGEDLTWVAPERLLIHRPPENERSRDGIPPQRFELFDTSLGRVVALSTADRPAVVGFRRRPSVVRHQHRPVIDGPVERHRIAGG